MKPVQLCTCYILCTFHEVFIACLKIWPVNYYSSNLDLTAVSSKPMNLLLLHVVHFSCCLHFVKAFCAVALFYSGVISVFSSFAITPKRKRELRTGPEVIKLFPCSTQLSTKFILLINVKMPTIVGILTFISMINTTSVRLKARNVFIWRYFSFYEQLKFHAQLS